MPQPEAWTLRQKIIGVLLRQARLEAGKTLKECGQVLGFSSGVVSAIEHGKRAISLPELELLAYYLSVPVDYFLDNGNAPSDPSLEELPSEEVLMLRHRIIAALLNQTRSEQGLSQRELAEMAGLSKRRLSQYEQGQTPIPLVELEAMAKALDVPLTYFLDEGIGPVGEHQQHEREWRQFAELPPDVRAFVLEPVNLSYLRMAMHLSQVPADGLRNIAASLLDITF
jgi:transcriptional regulator with XRE-family HTH domain